eukprot:1446787-Amphidinium_carterae.1
MVMQDSDLANECVRTFKETAGLEQRVGATHHCLYLLSLDVLASDDSGALHTLLKVKRCQTRFPPCQTTNTTFRMMSAPCVRHGLKRVFLDMLDALTVEVTNSLTQLSHNKNINIWITCVKLYLMQKRKVDLHGCLNMQAFPLTV